MSESFPNQFENHELQKQPEHQEALPSPERHEVLALPDAAHAEKLRDGEKDPLLALAEARSTIAETAPEDSRQALAESLKAAEGAPQAPVSPQTISRDLKAITLKRELRGLQRHESMPQRALSKVIHQPLVVVVSQAASGTVSRPSGLLGGGIVAFIGTSAYLYLAKHLGFEYNFMVFLVLFGGGFVFGLLLELLVHVAMMSRAKAIDA